VLIWLEGRGAYRAGYPYAWAPLEVKKVVLIFTVKNLKTSENVHLTCTFSDFWIRHWVGWGRQQTFAPGGKYPRAATTSMALSSLSLKKLYSLTAYMRLLPTRGIVIRRVCWLVGWLVRSWHWLWLLFFRRIKIPFHKSWHRCPASVPNLTINFSEVKIKVQGQNYRTENRPHLIARLRFKIYSPNLAIRHDRNNFSEIWLPAKFKMAAWWRFAMSGCFFS